MAKRDRMSGNEAVAMAMKQINPDVMGAFPIGRTCLYVGAALCRGIGKTSYYYGGGKQGFDRADQYQQRSFGLHGSQRFRMDTDICGI